MKKVLVIGANSYIGKKFYEYINSLNEKSIEADMVSATDGSWEKVDFSLYDTVLHLSAIVYRKEKESTKELYENVNHRLPVRIAHKAKENHVKQFIFMSSAAVYGDISGCITKETIPVPSTFYGKTKLAAENDLIKLESTEFKIVIVRSPMVYGEGCKGNYRKLSKIARFTPVFPDYHNKRSMIHVERLSSYIVDLILKEEQGCYFLQDENYADTCELVVGIRKKLGKKTYLTKVFNPLIGQLKNRFNIFDKIFGDMYYLNKK